MGVTFRGPWAVYGTAVHYALKEVTPPTTEPVTLALAKTHLRVTDTSEDALITARIVAARQQLERDTGHLVARATYDLGIDIFPQDGIISFPVTPLSSVTSLTFYDVLHASTVVAATNYLVDRDSVPPRVIVDYDADPVWWPNTDVRLQRAGVLRFIGGPEASAASPAWAVQAIYLLLSHWHDTREAVVVGTTAAVVPYGYEHIVDSYRIQGVV